MCSSVQSVCLCCIRGLQSPPMTHWSRDLSYWHIGLIVKDWLNYILNCKVQERRVTASHNKIAQPYQLCKYTNPSFLVIFSHQTVDWRLAQSLAWINHFNLCNGGHRIGHLQRPVAARVRLEMWGRSPHSLLQHVPKLQPMVLNLKVIHSRSLHHSSVIQSITTPL